jgi:glyoxylase-like metal-dependent hydrolase (beta-lactamase superfamily II)
MTNLSLPAIRLQAVRRASALACLMLSAVAAPALAAAPMQKTQPGYYRTMVGDYEVTALSDGTNALPASDLLDGLDKPAIRKQLDDAFVSDPVETSINAYLVNTGRKLILIDTGAGGTIDRNSGHLLDSLKAAGYWPAQVDEIYLTHLHLDHAGGLARNGQRVFPNAIVRVERKEADYWTDPANAAKAVGGGKKSFTVAAAVLRPYIAAGRFRPFDGDGELSPGIRSVASHGHTPGHNAYLVSSKGQSLMIFGDLVHVGAIQFPHPEVTIAFDSDEHEAQADRRQVFDAMADQRELVAGAHISFPGIGHIVKDGSGYRWIPLNYARVH